MSRGTLRGRARHTGPFYHPETRKGNVLKQNGDLCATCHKQDIAAILNLLLINCQLPANMTLMVIDINAVTNRKFKKNREKENRRFQRLLCSQSKKSAFPTQQVRPRVTNSGCLRMEWKARKGTGFSGCGVSPGPSLSRPGRKQ